MELNIILLLVLSGIGMLFLISGILISATYRKKINRCSEKTLGTIVKYSYLSRAFAPIAKFCVDGESYEIKRKFRGVIEIKKPLSLHNNKGAYVSDKDFLHIHRAAITDFESMAKTLYPLGSKLTVYYNPQKPKEAFLEKLPSKSSVLTLVFIGTGIYFILLGTLIYFLV